MEREVHTGLEDGGPGREAHRADTNSERLLKRSHGNLVV